MLSTGNIYCLPASTPFTRSPYTLISVSSDQGPQVWLIFDNIRRFHFPADSPAVMAADSTCLFVSIELTQRETLSFYVFSSINILISWNLINSRYLIVFSFVRKRFSFPNGFFLFSWWTSQQQSTDYKVHFSITNVLGFRRSRKNWKIQ